MDSNFEFSVQLFICTFQPPLPILHTVLGMLYIETTNADFLLTYQKFTPYLKKLLRKTRKKFTTQLI